MTITDQATIINEFLKFFIPVFGFALIPYSVILIFRKLTGQ
jgi:hypothetical protein